MIGDRGLGIGDELDASARFEVLVFWLASGLKVPVFKMDLVP